MKFKSIMHVALYVEDMEQSIDFYVNKLGGKTKIVTPHKVYANSEKEFQRRNAIEDPDGIFLTYIELAPGQFIELFPKFEYVSSKDTVDRVGIWHFALLVEDIYKTREEFKALGIPLDTEISIGNSNTYKFWSHDPDGNKFEIMQYTDKSFQIVGNV